MRFQAWILLIGWVLSACVGPSPTGSPMPDVGNSTPPPSPSVTPLPTVTPTPSPLPSPTATLPPPPTPTPLTYTVVAGDTLIGIATRFGVTLDALLAANPGIDPQFLPVGATLIVPAPTDDTAPESVLATGVTLDAPVCYPVADGVWCLVVVANQGDVAVESLMLRVALRASDGRLLAEQRVAAPLNRLPVGEQMIVGAFFEQATGGQGQAALLTALPVAHEAERYLAATVNYHWQAEDAKVQIEGTATISGTASSIWLLGMAFDGAGRPLAYRRQRLSGGDRLPFSLALYPLQSPVTTVRVLIEARP